METRTGSTDLLQRLNLKEYEATALAHLLSAGRTTAPDISGATGIPKREYTASSIRWPSTASSK